MTTTTTTADRDGHACALCDHQPSSQRPFICTDCACAAVYEARFKSAQILLRREAYGRDIERAVRDGDSLLDGRASAASSTTYALHAASSASEDGDEGAPARRLAYDQLRSQRTQAKLRTRACEQGFEDTEADCQVLRDRLKRKREEMQSRRDLLRQGSVSLNDLATRLDAVKISVARTSSKADPLQKKTVDARAYMVREAAALWGLTVKRRKGRDGRIRETPYLAGMPVTDLQDLLSVRPEQLNASLLAMAYLLNQACAYLGVKMPSQLLLPDKEHAWPRILPVHSSYNEQAIFSPAATSKSSLAGHGTNSMPADGSGDSPVVDKEARARPLHLGQPLLKLFAEDMRSYESFVEAMSLLAYNIAWLAKTQGIEVCYRRKTWSWEGACNIGRNLLLLFGAPRRDPDQQRTADRSTKDATDEEALISLGTFSHGTNRNNLAGPSVGMLGLKEWKLANPSYLIKKVKDSLADRKMAGEWELLEEEEWENAAPGGEADDPTKPRSSQQDAQGKQARGWQKLKPRDPDNPGKG